MPRMKGTPNKNTELLRAGVKSAVEIVRESGMHPVEILMEASRFLRNIAVVLAPAGGDSTQLSLAVKEMLKEPNGRQNLEMMRRFFETAAAISYKAAEFGCAKLQRIDYAGDAPSGQTIENKMVFTLNIDQGQAPGRPVDVERVDTSDIQEANEEWFKKATLVNPPPESVDDEWADEGDD